MFDWSHLRIASTGYKVRSAYIVYHSEEESTAFLTQTPRFHPYQYPNCITTLCSIIKNSITGKYSSVELIWKAAIKYFTHKPKTLRLYNSLYGFKRSGLVCMLRGIYLRCICQINYWEWITYLVSRNEAVLWIQISMHYIHWVKIGLKTDIPQ